jgi:hypothetical protein
MNKWTTKEEQILMNYIEANDSDTLKKTIEHAHYMMYSPEEGGHPDLKPRTLKACVSRFYKICEHIQLTNKQTIMKKVIKELNEGLKDPEYKQAWIANIAMAQRDCERWYRKENNKVGKYLNSKDKLIIANKGAEYFLNMLAK